MAESAPEIELEVTKLPAAAQKILSSQAPAPLRQMAARGIVPGLKPGDLLTLLVVLTRDSDENLAKTAQNAPELAPADG